MEAAGNVNAKVSSILKQGYWFCPTTRSESMVNFFFFLISKNDIYMKDYSKHEEHRANPENTRRRKQRKNIKENQTTE